MTGKQCAFLRSRRRLCILGGGHPNRRRTRLHAQSVLLRRVSHRRRLPGGVHDFHSAGFAPSAVDSRSLGSHFCQHDLGFLERGLLAQSDAELLLSLVQTPLVHQDVSHVVVRFRGSNAGLKVGQRTIDVARCCQGHCQMILVQTLTRITQHGRVEHLNRFTPPLLGHVELTHRIQDMRVAGPQRQGTLKTPFGLGGPPRQLIDASQSQNRVA